MAEKHPPDTGQSINRNSQKSTPSGGIEGRLAARLALIDVERAVMEMRRGLPVVIEEAPGIACLALAAELVDQETLGFLEDLTGIWPHIHLTHRRAETLKIRLYTEGGVTLPINRPETANDPQGPLAQIVHLSDPARDLDFPLQGPFMASREPLMQSEIASLRLAKLAGLLPATVTSPLKLTGKLGEKPGEKPGEKLDVNGAQDAITKWAHETNLLSVSAAAIDAYEQRAAEALQPIGHLKSQLKRVTDAKVPLADAPDSRIFAFRPQGTGGGGPEHLAIVIGAVDASTPVLVRLHSECFTGDLLGSLKCDCGEQLRGAIAAISQAGSGILLYLAQEGRGIGLMNKLRAYQLQDQGFDTVDANLRLGFEVDERLFEAAAQMLRQLGVGEVALMTNNPDKVAQLDGHGIKVTERVPHAFPTNEHNAHYLATKAGKTGHLL